ncbi:hypothetical protein V6N12_041217 [Hibiscus sabdariffa]|uniref:RNase H type-1 domain-containing protein n=1 Tax=Hibiscus sabdariffa TaxID=183260 RepID=A0ABR2E615_9ROSI
MEPKDESVPVAELLAMYEGLLVSWERGDRRVVVEPNSANANRLLQDYSEYGVPYGSCWPCVCTNAKGLGSQV